MRMNHDAKTFLLQCIFIAIMTDKAVTGNTQLHSIRRASSLFDDNDSSIESNLPTFSPQFGGCFDAESQLLTCAIGPSSCPSGTTYLRPTEIDATHCHSPHHTRSCRCAPGSDSNSIEGALGPCAPNPESCQNPSDSELSSLDDTCSVLRDDRSSSSSFKFTQYPYCQEKFGDPPLHRCVLSRDECVVGVEDFFPVGSSSNTPRPECSCYHVHTGLCYLPSSPTNSSAVHASTSFCAVASYDCPTGYKFISAFDLDTGNLDGGPAKVCRLCKEEDVDGYETQDGSSVGAFWYDGKVIEINQEAAHMKSKMVSKIMESKMESNVMEVNKEKEVVNVTNDSGRNGMNSWAKAGIISAAVVFGLSFTVLITLNEYYRRNDPRVVVMKPSDGSYLKSSIKK